MIVLGVEMALLFAKLSCHKLWQSRHFENYNRLRRAWYGMTSQLFEGSWEQLNLQKHKSTGSHCDLFEDALEGAFFPNLSS